MSYQVLIHPKVARAIKELPKAHKIRLSMLIDTLKNNPIPFKKFDVKKLKGQRDRFRVRLGNFRLTYEVDKKEKLVMLLKLERRGKAYE
ncbi:type II toxin-antitoxin system RelE/ParE family toxin [Archaeoglobales archaeon]|nr:MAG: type II toxin-antitoxin system RelE/ParE family toxin [Archaeoglobales archaeon]